MDKQTENKYRKSTFLNHEYTDEFGQEIPELRTAVFEREAAVDAVAAGRGFTSEQNKHETGYYSFAKEVRELKHKHGIEEPVYRLDTEI